MGQAHMDGVPPRAACPAHFGARPSLSQPTAWRRAASHLKAKTHRHATRPAKAGLHCFRSIRAGSPDPEDFYKETDQRAQRNGCKSREAGAGSGDNPLRVTGHRGLLQPPAAKGLCNSGIKIVLAIDPLEPTRGANNP
jgi:hypothetical protein